MEQKPERVEAESHVVELRPETRKPYTRPAIIYELELETRAGSPLGIPDPLDPFGLVPQE